MPRYSSLLVAIFLIAASLTPAAGRASPKQFGKVKGRVVDVNNARIVQAEVLIIGEGLSWRLMTNTAGEFETALPIGDYQISIEADGFQRVAPQKFQIKAGKTQRFNLKMQIRKSEMLVPAAAGPKSNPNV